MTPAQARVYEALARYLATHAYAPSLEELARLSGLRSLATVHKHVQHLIAQGKVHRTGQFIRGLALGPAVVAATCPTCGQLRQI